MAAHTNGRPARLTRVLISGAVALALAGCAGSNGDGSSEAATATASSPGTARTPDPAADPDALLAPVRAFVDAVAAKDAEKVVESFTDNGVVIDVGRRIEGRDAVRRWAANETITGTLTVLRVERTDADRQSLLVRFAPGGAGGFQANYTFTVSGDRIALLDMQYA